MTPAWGPTGEAVFNRTYARIKANGEKETWRETVERVVDGNLALVDEQHISLGEREALIDGIYNFRLLPAGRHLWMSGVTGSQHLFNCWRAGFDANDPASHFVFTFMRLMEGGGVGANYSNTYIGGIGVENGVVLHLVCRDDHPDIDELKPYLSTSYSPDWLGCVEIADSREGWAEGLECVVNSAVRTTEPHDLVVDLSLIRERGSRIRTFGGVAAGPGPLAKMLTDVASVLNRRVGHRLSSLDAMAIDHAIATCVVSGNVRRSARMSIKHWADDDIFDFIQCKADSGDFWSTNISVGVDDSFFDALAAGGEHAQKVMEAVVAGMLTNGEPGFYNISAAQQGELGDVAATNPCGEITLEPHEPCNLGHINLDAFVRGDGSVDQIALYLAHQLTARFLIRATFGDVSDPKSREVLARNRRIGVGHLGFHGFAVKQGLRFSESHCAPQIIDVLRTCKAATRAAARDYAFELRIPEPIKVTTIAPTGTVAKLAGRTEGIHPVYARYFVRRVRYADNDPALWDLLDAGHRIDVDGYSPNTMVVEFVTRDTLVEEVDARGLDSDRLIEDASEIDLHDMLAVQRMYQQCYADNAVSFTVNVPDGKYTVAEVSAALQKYLPSLKGTTIFPDKSRPQSPYERLTREQYDVAVAKSTDDSYDADCRSGACPTR